MLMGSRKQKEFITLQKHAFEKEEEEDETQPIVEPKRR
jgi:hypothetical protein